MGVRQYLKGVVDRAADNAGNKVSKLSRLSSEQLKEIEDNREEYLEDKPDPKGSDVEELTERLLAANGIEVYNTYLPQIDQLYEPVEHNVEYNGRPFDDNHNIRYLKITKWVTDKDEKSIEKLVNVYESLSNEVCNIALIFHRMVDGTEVYLGITNTENDYNNNNADSYINRIETAIRGNFPGSEWKDEGMGIVPCLDSWKQYSIASATNVPAEKSENFNSQTIEKLLDGVVPRNRGEEYTIILLATPMQNADSEKLKLQNIYSGLAPYAGWQTNYTYNENTATGAGATFGVNAGGSIGSQQGSNSTNSSSYADTDQRARNEGKTDSLVDSEANSDVEGESVGLSGGFNVNLGVPFGGPSIGIGKGNNTNISKSHQRTISRAKSAAHTVSKTLGRAVTRTASTTKGVFEATNLGVNFGANFARSSNVTVTIGENEGITQSFTNYNIKHTLKLLEEQMKRYEESSALGMWDFAAYVVSENSDIANNVAHSYIALTEGERSYMSKTAINLWRGDIEARSEAAEEIYSYLRELRHPVFGLNPKVVEQDKNFNVYPAVVTATTSLTGKELAYSLNFPKKSIAGLPVIECADFGRNVVTYDDSADEENKLYLGSIFHMNHEERTKVMLSENSLASHVFVTGSTGSGKSNTVYQIIKEARWNDVKFLAVEPAKGEYKNVFGNDEDVTVYSTNPEVSELLKLNPFSFPDRIHVFEHIDRLVEIFNVCWPMYAAMPAVLKDAIERSYSDCGWNLTDSTNPYGENLYPSFADVARNIRDIIDTSEYDAENKGAYKGSLLTRLKSLTNGINGLIFSGDPVPDDKLFNQNVIVDLSRVGSTETKSLMMGILVLKLQEYRMSEEVEGNSGLKHITVLEEAHNLLRRTPAGESVETGNLTGKSVEMLSNAIAEMRTYGEGFVIVDQAPGLLDMAAIRNTNTKIIMRLPDLEDRELVGRAANLNEDQIEELAKLPCGAAAVYQNEWLQPVLCKVARYDGEKGRYIYNRTKCEKAGISNEEALHIAELLSNGTKLDKNAIMHDVMPVLERADMSASSKVIACKMLMNPSETPRMTKMAAVISELFPDEMKTLKNVYKDTSDSSAWTKAVENQLISSLQTKIDDQVRRDIIQCIVTEYLVNELGSDADFQKWAVEGGLR